MSVVQYFCPVCIFVQLRPKTKNENFLIFNISEQFCAYNDYILCMTGMKIINAMINSPFSNAFYIYQCCTFIYLFFCHDFFQVMSFECLRCILHRCLSSLKKKPIINTYFEHQAHFVKIVHL